MNNLIQELKDRWIPLIAMPVVPILLFSFAPVRAKKKMKSMRHEIYRSNNSMVVNRNRHQLPYGCESIKDTVSITVRAGRKFAEPFPSKVYTYDEHEWVVEPCSKVRVTLINKDHIRHQWMIHGLPKYLYPMGMFTISVTGPGRETGEFIVPSKNKTYLVHCDISSHSQKGMKAQLIVGEGSGDLASIPTISGPRYVDNYEKIWGLSSYLTIPAGFILGLLGFLLIRKI